MQIICILLKFLPWGGEITKQACLGERDTVKYHTSSQQYYFLWTYPYQCMIKTDIEALWCLLSLAYCMSQTGQHEPSNIEFTDWCRFMYMCIILYVRSITNLSPVLKMGLGVWSSWEGGGASRHWTLTGDQIDHTSLVLSQPKVVTPRCWNWPFGWWELSIGKFVLATQFYIVYVITTVIET